MSTTYQADDSAMGATPAEAGPPVHRWRGCGDARHERATRYGPHARGEGRRFTPPYIIATVIGFVVFWPIGLALLVWGFWREPIRSSRLFRKLRGAVGSATAGTAGSNGLRGWMAANPGNSALAAYLVREQDRLRAEQEKLDELVQAFDAFKSAERQHADQRDFDAFLRQREGDIDADTNEATPNVPPTDEPSAEGKAGADQTGTNPAGPAR